MGNSIAAFGGFKHAIVFDQSLVENVVTRCSYVWDGATQNKYNVGCGLAAPVSGPKGCLKDANSGFFNQCCPGHNSRTCSNGHTCNMSDVIQVSSERCSVAGGAAANALPKSKSDATCFLPGPAVDYTQQEGWTPNSKNLQWLRKNLNFRVTSQDGKFDATTWKKEQNNELVLDVRLLMPNVWKDPATAITAFVYIKDVHQKEATEIARKEVIKARDEFRQVNGMTDDIPVIAINAQADATKGPQNMFEVDSEEEEAAEEEHAEVLA